MLLKAKWSFRQIFITIFIIYWLPFLVIHGQSRTQIASEIAALPKSDAVIIFGALVRDGTVSPLQAQRLNAALAIWQMGLADKIVVSNLGKATLPMVNYLKLQNVPDTVIEIDSLADDTPDTCRFEKTNHPESRQLIFVSQGFHLPRILYQCKKLGVTGTGFPAENLASQTTNSTTGIERLWIKSGRYVREAFLTWLAVLGFYK